MNASDVRRLERVIDASGVVARVEARIDDHKNRSGRPRELSVRTLLIAVLYLASTGSMHLVRVPALLNGLDRRTKKRLGVLRSGGVTRRQVERLYNLVADSLEASGIHAFDEVCDMLLAATLDQGCNDTTSIAIDGTSVDSWGSRRSYEDANGNVVWVATDPDARWRAKSKDSPWKRPVFGYDLTVAVTIPELDGVDVPLAARVMRFRPANRQPVAMGREVMIGSAKQQGTLGDVLVDREYTKRVDGTDFVLPVRALGGEPVFDLMTVQRAGRGTVRGAVIIDGQPFSPSILSVPGLLNITPPPVNAPWPVIAAYQARIETRAKYALVPHGSRKANGSQVFQCPASAGKLACSLKPSPTARTNKSSSNNTRKKIPFMVVPPNTASTPEVCSKKFTTFDAVDLPLSQRHLYGSNAWWMSYNRRSRVEGFFGNLKNEACENLRRGTIRVRGLVKTGILVAFAVASTNLRLARTFASRAPKPQTRRRGRPKKTGVVAVPAVLASINTANAPPPAA
jgi:hypothetical protein